MSRTDIIPMFVAVALVVCALGILGSCESDCRKRGGTLVRAPLQGYVCMKGERLR